MMDLYLYYSMTRWSNGIIVATNDLRLFRMPRSRFCSVTVKVFGSYDTMLPSQLRYTATLVRRQSHGQMYFRN